MRTAGLTDGGFQLWCSMGFLKRAQFIMHSGAPSQFKIECDALDNEDIETCAWLIAQNYTFCEVHGIPSGGLRLAKALQKYQTPGKGYILLVDDVITTGRSMVEAQAALASERPEVFPLIRGVCIFSRARTLPAWISTLFQLTMWGFQSHEA